MNNVLETKTINDYSKIAGFSQVALTVIGLINTFAVKPGLYYNADILLESEFQFRMAQVLDILMIAFTLWLSVALYIVAKSINKNFAKFAVAFRAGEVFIGFVIVLISLAPLMIMKNAHINVFNDNQLYSLTGLFFDLSQIGWNLQFITMGIGAFLFIYMFTFSSYIPKWLGYWGLFTYTSMVICFTLKILLPKFPENLMMIMAPGALFEFVFGIWLFVKGVNVLGTKKS